MLTIGLKSRKLSLYLLIVRNGATMESKYDPYFQKTSEFMYKNTSDMKNM